MRGVGGSAGRMPCLRSASLLVQKVYIGRRCTRCPAHNSVSSLALIAIAATRRRGENVQQHCGRGAPGGLGGGSIRFAASNRLLLDLIAA